eukprot:CAMPEP_0184710370 /NCGR_PEP_ID=MMETSP0314-20130426/1203_1 /TAXON_ID=38298 /ORGANISM="Rhodella maculata, Strain CCMP 736" /LENGTH=172 /DNA_ID=CAMNT_0027172199 /DNA_START=72 /DNA_END=587 /DNA_ORIENTATION=+
MQTRNQVPRMPDAASPSANATTLGARARRFRSSPFQPQAVAAVKTNLSFASSLASEPVVLMNTQQTSTPKHFAVSPRPLSSSTRRELHKIKSGYTKVKAPGSGGSKSTGASRPGTSKPQPSPTTIDNSNASNYGINNNSNNSSINNSNNTVNRFGRIKSGIPFSPANLSNTP